MDLKQKLNAKENKEYKIETRKISGVYISEITNNKLLGLYYLIFKKKLLKSQRCIGTCLSHHVSLKDDKYFSQRLLEKNNNNVFVSTMLQL